jgi:PRTRC genetic system protein B
MPTVTAGESQAYSLENALLIYTSPKSRHYVSVHGVMHIPGQAPKLGAGSPITRAALSDMFSSLKVEVGVKGWISDRVLYVGDGMLAWWLAAGVRTLFVKGLAAGMAAHPPLVFAVIGSQWYVWALKDNERPNPHTQLMNAPYFNVYKNGDICVGNVKLPATLAPETTGEFERAFFESRFTHASHTDLINYYQGGIAALQRDLLKGVHAAFDPAWLSPAGIALGDALRMTSKESDDDDL